MSGVTEVTFDTGSDQIDKGTIEVWFLEEGDQVEEGDDLAEVSTSEGPIVVQAPCAGILTEVNFDEGEVVEKDEVICVISNEGQIEDHYKDDPDEEDDEEDEKDEDEEEDEDEDEEDPYSEDDDEDGEDDDEAYSDDDEDEIY